MNNLRIDDIASTAMNDFKLLAITLYTTDKLMVISKMDGNIDRPNTQVRHGNDSGCDKAKPYV